MKSMRAIINNLRPTVLDLGLNAAIEWQVREFQRRTGIVCGLMMDEEDFILDDNRATALFRILQESLSNVIRHARANRVDVELHRKGSDLVMKVADDGVGAFPDCRRKTNSFGLIGIKERISAFGGELGISSGEGKGTTLMITIPMEENVIKLAQNSRRDDIAPNDVAATGTAETRQIAAKQPIASRRRKNSALQS
jgi:signal transduction histidine kinase